MTYNARKRAFEDELESLAFGELHLDKLPSIGLRRTAKSIIAYVKAWHTYRRGGFPRLYEYMDYLYQHFAPVPTVTPLDSWRLARRGVVPLRITGRVLRESSNCLESSVSLAAGLIALGLRGQIVIARIPDFDGFRFHAWAEVLGKPVNEDELAPVRYPVLMKYPEWGEVPESTAPMAETTALSADSP